MNGTLDENFHETQTKKNKTKNIEANLLYNSK